MRQKEERIGFRNFILWCAPSEREWEGRAETWRFFFAMRDVHTACKASTYSARDLGVKPRERANRIRSLTPEHEKPHFLIPLLHYAEATSRTGEAQTL